MQWYDYWLWFYVAVIGFGVFASIAMVGKPRTPITGPVAAFITALGFITMWALTLKLHE